MKKTFDFLFKFTSLLFIFSLTFILYSTPVSAKELPSNNSKVEIKFVDNNLHVFRKDVSKKKNHILIMMVLYPLVRHIADIFYIMINRVF